MVAFADDAGHRAAAGPLLSIYALGRMVAALWYGWQEPLPRVPHHIMGSVQRRTTLKEKMQPGWEPEEYA